MSSIRKCKACNRAVKGHPGPYGMAKCKNVPLDEDEEADLMKTNEMEVVQEFYEENKDDTESHVNVVANLTKQKHGLQSVIETVQPKETVENNLVAESLVEDPNDVSGNSECSDEDDDDASHFLNEYGNKSVAKRNDDIKYDGLNRSSDTANDDEEMESDDDPKVFDINDHAEKPPVNEEECMDEIPDCSLGEVSLTFGAATSEEERRRLYSQSDNNVDIRNLILGRAFVLCFCDNFDCECEGEVKFDESLKGQVGVVENMYLDPREDSEIDLEPKVSFIKTGWKAHEPNIIKFKLGLVSTPGVLSSTGEMVLTASRLVEMVKGRKELSTVITGRLGLTLKLGKEYTDAGYRSNMKFKDLECNLFMIEEEGGEAPGVNEDLRCL